MNRMLGDIVVPWDIVIAEEGEKRVSVLLESLPVLDALFGTQLFPTKTLKQAIRILQVLVKMPTR